jgi:hypothetical protein
MEAEKPAIASIEKPVNKESKMTTPSVVVAIIIPKNIAALAMV